MRVETPTQRQKFLKFLAAVFGQQSPAALEQHLAELNPPLPYRIRIKVLYSPAGPAGIAKALDLAGTPQRLRETGPGYSIVLRSAEDRQPKTFFAVLPTDKPHVGILISVCERDEWLLLLRFVRRLYPRVVPVFLAQRELLEAVSALRQNVSSTYDLRIREMSAKEVVRGVGGDVRRSIREWTFEEWERALSHVSERRLIVHSLGFEFYRRIENHIDVVAAAHCKITKRGEIELTGRYDIVRSVVVNHVATVGEQKLSFYSRRGLREREYKAAPLAIKYQGEVFTDITEIRRLVGALSRYPRSMHAVQHGNPYAHVRVSDAYDGSSFDVWAVSAEQITIVPRLKATEAAVARLIQFIFDEFREGSVVETRSHG